MSDVEPQVNWRIKLGFAIFVASIGWPILIPILPLLGVSAQATATFGGVMVVAAELMILVGATIAGKEGFAFIKAKVLGIFKPCLPPQQVSRRRYTIGLVLFSISLFFGWASPYFGHHLPSFEQRRFFCAVGGDVILLTSLFVLGGGFWDKLRCLFRHDAYAVIPTNSPDGDGDSRSLSTIT